MGIVGLLRIDGGSISQKRDTTFRSDPVKAYHGARQLSQKRAEAKYGPPVP